MADRIEHLMEEHKDLIGDMLPALTRVYQQQRGGVRSGKELELAKLAVLKQFAKDLIEREATLDDAMALFDAAKTMAKRGARRSTAHGDDERQR